MSNFIWNIPPQNLGLFKCNLSCVIMFPRLEVELVHIIDVFSPFYGLSRDVIDASDFVLVLMMSGVDENLHDMIHDQHEYTHSDVRATDCCFFSHTPLFDVRLVTSNTFCYC